VHTLALANPLTLDMITSFEMSQIIDWIDQVDLSMYVNGEAASRFASMGIRGAIEFFQVKAYVSHLAVAEKEQSKT
jgi:hypothetical protein